MSNTDYVTKRTAIALKEAGYDEMAAFAYINNRVLSYQTGGARNSDFQSSTVIPTWTAAAAWLYEKHRIKIDLHPYLERATVSVPKGEEYAEIHRGFYESAFLAAIGMIKREVSNAYI